MVPYLVGKYKSLVLPELAGLQPVCALLGFLTLQCRNNGGSRCDRAPLSVFGGNQPVGSGFSRNVLKLFINQNRSFVQVYTVPCETADFPPSASR